MTFGGFGARRWARCSRRPGRGRRLGQVIDGLIIGVGALAACRFELEPVEQRRRIAEDGREALFHLAAGRRLRLPVITDGFVEQPIHAPADSGSHHLHAPPDIGCGFRRLAFGRTLEGANR